MSVKPQQRQTGSIVPEVIADASVARSVLPTSVAEFDGWEPADVVTWLEGVGEQFRLGRISIGLALWVLRDRVSEAEYSQAADRIADLFDVDERTLRRWRKAAQDQHNLPEPGGAKKRALGQAKREEPATPAAPQVRTDCPNLEADDERPPSTGLRTSRTNPPADVLGQQAVSPSPTAPSEPQADPEERVRAFADRLIASGADRAAKTLGLERSRNLADWAKRVERAAIRHSAEARAANHTKEQREQAATRRDVTPRFKGGT